MPVLVKRGVRLNARWRMENETSAVQLLDWTCDQKGFSLLPGRKSPNITSAKELADAIFPEKTPASEPITGRNRDCPRRFNSPPGPWMDQVATGMFLIIVQVVWLVTWSRISHDSAPQAQSNYNQAQSNPA